MSTTSEQDLFGQSPELDRALADATAIGARDELDLGPDRRGRYGGLSALGWLVLLATVATIALVAYLYWTRASARDEAADLRETRDRLVERIDRLLDEDRLEATELTDALEGSAEAASAIGAADEVARDLRDQIASLEATIDALPRPALPPSLLAQVSVDGGVGPLAARPGAVVTASASGVYSVLAADTRRVVATRRVDVDSVDLAVEGELAWIADASGALLRLDPVANEVRTFDIGGVPSALAVADGVAWVGLDGDRALVALDSSTGELLERVDLAGSPHDVVVGPDALWVGFADQNAVTVVDRATTAVRLLEVPGVVEGLALTEDGATAWVALSSEPRVIALDATGHAVADVRVPGGAHSPVLLGSSLWALSGDETLIEIDTDLGAVVSRTAVGSGAVDLVAAHGDLWIATAAEAELTVVSLARTGG